MKKENKRQYLLNIADFYIKLTFLPTAQSYLKESIEDQVEKVWGDRGYFVKKSKKVDFEIVFEESEGKVEVLQKQKGKKHYYLTFVRDYKKKKITTYYYTSIASLNMILKDVLTHLLKGNGLLIHASAVVNSKSEFLVFLAKSGGGKSTISEIVAKSQGYTKVADDSLVIRMIGNDWVYYSSPFIEKDKLPKFSWSKKARVYFLIKGKKVKVEEFGGNTLKPLLEQLWLRYDDIDKKTLSIAMRYAKENDFFILRANLNKKDLLEVLK